MLDTKEQIQELNETLGELDIAIPVMCAYQAIAVFVMFLLSEIMWRAGIKRFTGVGV